MSAITEDNPESIRLAVPSDGILIIVNYNQVEDIQDVLDRAEKYFPKEQTVVIDDCSDDGSREIAQQSGFEVIVHSRNMGNGSAIRSGLCYAKEHGFRWVVLSSSNGKIKPEEYHIVYGPVVRGEADYVTGSRFMRGGESPGLGVFRKLAIPIFSLAASIVIGRRYSDITCGFRSYLLKVLEDSQIDIDQEWLNRYELEYYLHYLVTVARKWRIKEVPVTIEYVHLTPGRESKIRPVIGWWSMIRPFVFLRLGLRR